MRELFLNYFHHFTAINDSLIVNIKVYYIIFAVPSVGVGTILCDLGVFCVVMDPTTELVTACDDMKTTCESYL